MARALRVRPLDVPFGGGGSGFGLQQAAPPGNEFVTRAAAHLTIRQPPIVGWLHELACSKARCVCTPIPVVRRGA